MKRCFLLSILFFFVQLRAQEFVTVMTYNLLNYTNNNTNAIGNNANRAQLFRQIIETAQADVIMLQEVRSDTVGTYLVNELNTNGILGKTYNNAPNFTAYSNLGNMLIYNDDLFDFVSQAELPRNNSQPSPNGSVDVIAPRAVSQYILNLINPECDQQTVEMQFYSMHLKAGTDEDNGSTQISDRDRRVLGVLDLMDVVNAQPATANIFVGGDFNFYSMNAVNSPTVYSEPAYPQLLSGTNANPLIDVLGGWTRNIAADASKYTQSTRTAFNEYGNGGASGGMDDRFDFIFINGAVNNGTNYVTYQTGTYATLGNAGVAWNAAADSGTSPIGFEVKQMSDHYPVIMTVEVTFNPDDACCGASGGFILD